MKMKRTLLQSTLVSLALVASAGSVQAAEMIDATNPNEILEIAKGFGTASLQKDSDGDPYISGMIEGVKYGIAFYGCESGRNCDDIQFGASWSKKGVSLNAINTWNQTRRFGKAYLDNDKEPTIEMAVNIDQGVSRENMEDSFRWWTRIVKLFVEEVVTK
jgi:hypothetical protein